MTTPQQTDDRKTRRRNVALLVVLLVLVLGGLAEGLVRLRGWMRHGSTDVFDLLEDHPDAAFKVARAGISATIAGKHQVDIDSRGFRSPEIEIPKPDGTVRLAFLGGSTTICAEVSSNAHTWPQLVTDALAADHADVRFDHVNAGVTGHRTQHSLLNLEHRVAAVDPDVIVIYHATNDLAWDTAALATQRGLYEYEPRSWLADYSLLWELIEKNLRWNAAQERVAAGSRVMEYDPAEVSVGFRERLTELVREARRVADVVVLVTFAPKARIDQPPELRHDNLRHVFKFMPFLSPDGILAGYTEYNRVIREVAAATGAVLVDDPESIPSDDEHYHDSVHFADAGAGVQAARVAAVLSGSDELAAVLAARR